MEQILSEQPPPTILRRRVQGVLKNTRHILELVNQMLDLSKIESKRMQVEATRGDIIAYTQELAMRFQPLVEKKELKLYFVVKTRTDGRRISTRTNGIKPFIICYPTPLNLRSRATSYSW
ncbi:MAG: HAMP domain-containing histidine kinase [Lewinellaceae bacterium]|nr:HAMP domain-containing histidine kinase [Lewinellaceae bacterium]